MPVVRAMAKQVGASPKRLKPIMDAVRGMTVNDALDHLSLMTVAVGAVGGQGGPVGGVQRREQRVHEPQRAAHHAHFGRPGAAAQALSEPRARGRIGRVTRRSSHIIIEVDEIQEG